MAKRAKKPNVSKKKTSHKKVRVAMIGAGGRAKGAHYPSLRDIQDANCRVTPTSREYETCITVRQVLKSGLLLLAIHHQFWSPLAEETYKVDKYKCSYHRCW